MSVRDCLIVGAAPVRGEDGFYAGLLQAYPMVIAADAAGEWCLERGRVPDVVVGDLDSAAEGARVRLEAAGARVVELPVVKDVTDLSECITEARRRGAEHVDVCAAFTGRIDHTLAAIGDVLRAADLRARIVEPSWRGWTLDGSSLSSVEMVLPVGALFSVIAPGGARGVSILGARYPLDDEELPALSGRGVSNVASGDMPVRVSVREGAALVVVPDDGARA